MALILCIIAAVIVSAQLLSPVSALPIQEVEGPWVNPCGGSTPVLDVSFSLPSPPAKPIGEELLSLKLMTKTAVSINDEIAFIIRPLITDETAEELDSHPSFPGFPSTNASYSSGITIENLLQIEVERMAKVSVFVEQAHKDTYDYTKKIIQLEDKNVEVLCQMHRVLKQHNQEVTSQVSRDIMSEDWKNLVDSSIINQRNYLIVRDARKIAISIAENIDAYMKENNL